MEQDRIRCTIIRGGTSKGVYIMRNELPSDPIIRDKVVRAIFGSPDIRQIDGLGGADPLTSKLAVIGPPSREGCDCDYVFAQIDINTPKINWGGVCGNISSGVGPFAIDEGLVEPKEPITRVRINYPSLKPPRTLIAEVPVVEGKAKIEGEYHIDGVPGTGAKIVLDWSDVAGGTTGNLLPTGNVKDTINVGRVGAIEASIVDCPGILVYCRAKDFGLKGIEGPQEFDSNPELLKRLIATQEAAAKLINIDRCTIAVVAKPAEFRDHTTGRTIRVEEMDFLLRHLYMGKLHKTIGGSVTVNCGVAAKIPGSIVNEMVSEEAGKQLELRIGHAAGTIACESQVEVRGTEIQVKKNIISRTARRIMDGYVYVPKSVISGR